MIAPTREDRKAGKTYARQWWSALGQPAEQALSAHDFNALAEQFAYAILRTRLGVGPGGPLPEDPGS